MSKTARRWSIWFALTLGVGGFLIFLDAERRGSAQNARSAQEDRQLPLHNYVPSPEELRASYERAFALQQKKGGGKGKSQVFKTNVSANWFDQNTRFWYRNDLRGGTKEFILVDADKAARGPAFDHQKLAAALSKAAEKAYTGDKLPFDTIKFVDESKAVEFKVGDKTWKCALATYELSVVAVESKKDDKKGDKKDDDKKDDGKKVELLYDDNGNAWVDPYADELEFEDDYDGLDPLEYDPQQKKGKKDQGDQKKGKKDQGDQKKGKGKGGEQGKGKGKGKGGVPANPKSPDGRWMATIKDFNVFLRDKEGKEFQLTKDGVKGHAYDGKSFRWSPTSKTLIAYRVQAAETEKYHVLDSSNKDIMRPKLIEKGYRIPGDKLEVYQIWLFDAESKNATKVGTEDIDFGGSPQPRWLKDKRHFLFQRTDRGHGRTRLIEVDSDTGATRNVIDEKAEARIVGAKKYLYYVNDGDEELIWASERDGWNHLYLIDQKTGQVKNQITKGDWVVMAVQRVDDKARQIWFSANSYNADQDPHNTHFYRINFDGTGLTALTTGNGKHAITYSPDRKYILDNYSRPDMAPITELRRVVDGSLVFVLEKADTSLLLESGWRGAEVFSALGRDNNTDIWGVVYRPKKLDLTKKYPIIEYIYAGPWTASAPKTFSTTNAMMSLAELGFIVVQIDGMGLPTRSRAFHDVSHKTHADAGLPDRILWIKALAKKYPYIDTTRVGIYGHSGGGYSSTRALLNHPDFYKVAVSSAGNHVPGAYNLPYSEQWMGAMGPHYAASSNAVDAHKLKGKLFLIHGESDTNVVCAHHTMKVVDALIKANKDFDLLIIPGANHGLGTQYVTRRRYDYFVKHLLGVEPPNQNIAPASGGKKGKKGDDSDD